jgi:uncharacterized protein (UPF0332 family)
MIDLTTKQKVFRQAIDMFVIPEIDRRKKIGKIPQNFILEKAQIIFSLRSGRNYVRLNNEVKAIIKRGDAVYEKDVDQIESVNLREKDSDYGHITLLLFRGSWIVAFDFRYNKKISQEHIKASTEFYESAKENLVEKRLRPFFENAFASAELSAKSILLSIPNKEILEGKNHRDRISTFKKWADLGNVKIEFSTTLSKLNSLRDSARYLVSNDFKKEDTNKILSTIKEMIKFAEDSIK